MSQTEAIAVPSTEVSIVDPAEPGAVQPLPQSNVVQLPQSGVVVRLDQLRVLKETVAPDCTDAELELFMIVCNRTGLDPFAKQLYALKRWNGAQNKHVLSIQTSIDGYRLIAERTGRYRGQLPMQWCGKDGVWTTEWVLDTPPTLARATVLKDGFDAPMIGQARYAAYVQTKRNGEPNEMWQRMHAEQLAKCAEALALRKAFPQELSGIYTFEEMGQAGFEHPEDPPAPDSVIQDIRRRILTITPPERSAELQAAFRRTFNGPPSRLRSARVQDALSWLDEMEVAHVEDELAPLAPASVDPDTGEVQPEPDAPVSAPSSAVDDAALEALGLTREEADAKLSQPADPVATVAEQMMRPDVQRVLSLAHSQGIHVEPAPFCAECLQGAPFLDEDEAEAALAAEGLDRHGSIPDAADVAAEEAQESAFERADRCESFCATLPKPRLVEQLRSRNLPTAGTIEALRARLADALIDDPTFTPGTLA